MRSKWILGLIVAVASLAASHQAFGHVQVNDPNGGEVFQVGDTVTIEWQILIAHTLLNWDVWYSTNSGVGPWTPIAMDLPAGSPAVGSIHSYEWTIPFEAADPTVWIRVRMDNSGIDYEDTSNAPFAIEAPIVFVRGDANSDGGVDIGDSIAILGYLFDPKADAPVCLSTADTNTDGGIDVADTVFLLSHLFVPGSPAPSEPYPECGSDPGAGGVICDTSICIP